MLLEDHLSGRKEKRRPIIVVVRLVRLDPESDESHERTYTDNLSAHGVRVFSSNAWHPGEQAEVTPVSEESPARGRVVYCQKVDDGHFCVGVNFPERIAWRIQQRFDGFDVIS